MYDRELNVSLKTKMFLEKIGIKTIGDAYKYLKTLPEYEDAEDI